jgi:glyoxylase-like metal-dependent hydrolase (beta-lactamase superfamily II)
MNKVKILIEGYAKELKNGWLGSSSTILIESNNKKIIVDPGINRKLLMEKLKEQNLTTDDIDYVFMTHYHPDHVFLAAIFDKAKIFDMETIYEEDKETSFSKSLPETDIKVIPTPGHAHEHASLLVPTENQGTIVIAGDLFWWRDNEEQKVDRKSLLSRKDPFVKDEKALLESRKKVLEIADFIIPGHGKMFKVEK